jgi:hypothetical protein
MPRLPTWVLKPLAWLWKRLVAAKSESSGTSQTISSKGDVTVARSPMAIQDSGTGGTNISTGEFHVHQGVSFSEVEKIALTVWRANFPHLKQEAMEEAERNIRAFLSDLEPRLLRELSPPQLKRFRAPDVQHSFSQALQGAALRKDASLRAALGDLIVKRVRASLESLEGIIYSEAIKTVPMLTESMLNILALKTLVSHADFSQIRTWPELDAFLAKHATPFLEYSREFVVFQHLVYSGCGTVAAVRFVPADFVSDLQRRCAHLFQAGLSDDAVNALGLPPAVLESLFEPENGHQKFSFKASSLAKLKATLEHTQLPSQTTSKITYLFQHSMADEKQSTAWFLNHVNGGADIVKKWSSCAITMFDLSSVGLVIGASHLESTTGLSLNLNLEDQAKQTLES